MVVWSCKTWKQRSACQRDAGQKWSAAAFLPFLEVFMACSTYLERHFKGCAKPATSTMLSMCIHVLAGHQALLIDAHFYKNRHKSAWFANWNRNFSQAWRWVQIPSKQIKTSWACQHWPHEIMGLCQIAPTRPGSLPLLFWGPLCRTKSPNSIQQLHPRDFPGWQACTHRWCMHTGCTLLFHSGPGRWPWSEHLGSRNGERTIRHHLPPDLKASQVA